MKFHGMAGALMKAMLLLGCLTANAQAQAPGQAVKVDLATGALTNALPFDVPFLIEGATGKTLPAQLICVQTSITKEGEKARALPTWYPIEGATSDSFSVRVPALEPEVAYTFEFTFVRELKPEETKALRARLHQTLSRRLWAVQGDPSRELAWVIKRTISSSGPLTNIVNLCGPPRKYEQDQSSSVDNRLSDLAIQAVRAQHILATSHANFTSTADAAEQAMAGLRSSASTLAARLVNGAAFSSKNEAIARLALLASLTDDDITLLVDGAAAWTLGMVSHSLVAEVDPKGESSSLTIRATSLAETAKSLRELDGLLRAGWLSGILVQQDITNVSDVAAQLEGRLLDLRSMVTAMTARAAAIDSTTELAAYRTAQIVGVVANNRRDYKARAAAHISMDLGLSWFPEFTSGSSLASYVGANLYVQPVNREAYLNWSDIPGDFFKRFSFLVGTTITSIDQAERRQGLFAKRGVLLGGGLRLTSYLRVNGGMVVFRRIDPNPLVENTTVAISPFVSTSIDVDIAGLFGGVASTVFGG